MTNECAPVQFYGQDRLFCEVRLSHRKTKIADIGCGPGVPGFRRGLLFNRTATPCGRSIPLWNKSPERKRWATGYEHHPGCHAFPAMHNPATQTRDQPSSAFAGGKPLEPVERQSSPVAYRNHEQLFFTLPINHQI